SCRVVCTRLDGKRGAVAQFAHSRFIHRRDLDCHLCHRHPEQTLEEHHRSHRLCCDRSVRAPRRLTDSGFSGAAVEPISRLLIGTCLRCRVDTLHQHTFAPTTGGFEPDAGFRKLPPGETARARRYGRSVACAALPPPPPAPPAHYFCG